MGANVSGSFVKKMSLSIWAQEIGDVLGCRAGGRDCRAQNPAGGLHDTLPSNIIVVPRTSEALAVCCEK